MNASVAALARTVAHQDSPPADIPMAHLAGCLLILHVSNLHKSATFKLESFLEAHMTTPHPDCECTDVEQRQHFDDGWHQEWILPPGESRRLILPIRCLDVGTPPLPRSAAMLEHFISEHKPRMPPAEADRLRTAHHVKALLIQGLQLRWRRLGQCGSRGVLPLTPLVIGDAQVTALCQPRVALYAQLLPAVPRPVVITNPSMPPIHQLVVRTTFMPIPSSKATLPDSIVSWLVVRIRSERRGSRRFRNNLGGTTGLVGAMRQSLAVISCGSGAYGRGSVATATRGAGYTPLDDPGRVSTDELFLRNSSTGVVRLSGSGRSGSPPVRAANDRPEFARAVCSQRSNGRCNVQLAASPNLDELPLRRDGAMPSDYPVATLFSRRDGVHSRASSIGEHSQEEEEKESRANSIDSNASHSPTPQRAGQMPKAVSTSIPPDSIMSSSQTVTQLSLDLPRGSETRPSDLAGAQRISLGDDSSTNGRWQGRMSPEQGADSLPWPHGDTRSESISSVTLPNGGALEGICPQYDRATSPTPPNGVRMGPSTESITAANSACIASSTSPCINMRWETAYPMVSPHLRHGSGGASADGEERFSIGSAHSTSFAGAALHPLLSSRREDAWGSDADDTDGIYTDDEDASGGDDILASEWAARDLLDDTVMWFGATDALLPSVLPGQTHEHVVSVAFTEAGDHRLTAQILGPRDGQDDMLEVLAETVIEHREA